MARGQNDKRKRDGEEERVVRPRDEPIDQAIVDQPAVNPAVDQPAVDQPAVDQPAVDQPAVNPAVDQPAVDQPAVDPAGAHSPPCPKRPTRWDANEPVLPSPCPKRPNRWGVMPTVEPAAEVQVDNGTLLALTYEALVRSNEKVMTLERVVESHASSIDLMHAARINDHRIHAATEAESQQKLADLAAMREYHMAVRAEAGIFWRPIFIIMELFTPIILSISWPTMDIVQRCFATVLPTADSIQFLHQGGRHHIGRYLEFLKSICPSIKYLIDSTDTADMNLKKYIVFWFISGCLYVVFLIVMLFVRCKGVVNQTFHEPLTTTTNITITMFVRNQYVSIRHMELRQTAMLVLLLITVGNCIIHDNTIKRGYVVLANWGIWAAVFIVHEMLLIIRHGEIQCAWLINAEPTDPALAAFMNNTYVLQE